MVIRIKPSLLNALLMVIAAFGCVLSVSYFFYNWFVFPLGDRTTLYWWHVSAHTFPPRLAIYLFVGAVLLSIFLFLRKSPKVSLFSTGFVLILLLVGNVSACVSSIPIVLERYRFVGSASFEEHVYYLDWSAKPGIGGDGRVLVALWECDGGGWFCKIIHREERNVLSENLNTVTAEMRQIAAGGDIEVVVDGEIIYRVPP